MISIQLNAGVIFVLHLVVWCSCQEGRGRRGRLPPTKFVIIQTDFKNHILTTIENAGDSDSTIKNEKESRSS